MAIYSNLSNKNALGADLICASSLVQDVIFCVQSIAHQAIISTENIICLSQNASR